MDIESGILNGIFYFNRLKRAYLRPSKRALSTLVHLKGVINLGTEISEQINYIEE